jgi:uroporphyrin-III C-methyltransferase
LERKSTGKFNIANKKKRRGEWNLGKVYLVGAGPGDPDLITVKGLKCIKEADVILYDRLVNDELLTYAKSNAELIYCGKLPDSHTLQQETINHLLVKHAQKGKVVVRLKGGDPFVFGRGGEEAETLANNRIEFEIVPGITAGIAAPAYAGIPITHREYGSSFAIVTGHRKNREADNIKWEAIAKGIDTVAIYMGVTNLTYIQEQLLQHGKNPETPTALIQWGTKTNQKTVISTLREVNVAGQREGIENPCMIVIGDVVNMHYRINWFENKSINETFIAREAF